MVPTRMVPTRMVPTRSSTPRRLLAVGALVASAMLALVPGIAASAEEDGPVAVVDVVGPADQRVIDFVVEQVVRPEARIVVLRIDSPGVASGDVTPLFDAIAAADVPVVAWIGPAGAVAHGGMAQAALLGGVTGAAPGARLGYLLPAVAGDEDGELPAGLDAATLGSLLDDVVEVTEPIPGIVDIVEPTIGQFIAALDEVPLRTAAGDVVVDTARTEVGEDGAQVVVPATRVEFRKPGLFTRFLRLGVRPEAAFFFLVVGLSAAAFEFYAAGIGITAAVASVSLLLAGYGIAVLPTSWPAVVATLLGLLLYTADFQRNQLGVRSIAGTALLLWGGLTFTRAAPQFGPRPWAVVLTVVGIAAFYLFAMTTVARSRFSTRTIGRDHLVGRRGVAETGFDPEGVVIVDGARWRARSHRAAGLGPGDPIEVLEVRGIVLEVGPPHAEEPAAPVRE